MAHHEEENQHNGNHGLLTSSSLVYTKNGQRLQQLISFVVKRLRSVIKRKGDVTQWSKLFECVAGINFKMCLT